MSEANRFPEFIVGGAPKSGTSSLYFWLSAHPQVCGSKVKEPYYFGRKVRRQNASANYLEHGLSRYSSFFSHCPPHLLAFEASAGYLYSSVAREGLMTLPEPPKMVFVLRTPEQQAYSHFRMEKYRTRTIDCGLEEYLDREYVREMWQYHISLDAWFREYDSDKIYVVLFEDLMQNKVARMKDICSFLDIDASFYQTYDFEHRNETIQVKRKFLHQWGLRVQRYIPHAVQRSLLPLYMKLNSKGVPKMTDGEREVLQKRSGEFDEEKRILHEKYPNLSVQSFWKY